MKRRIVWYRLHSPCSLSHNRLIRAPYGSDCDLHGLDLSSKVFSGVVMERTDLTGTKIRGTEMSRTDAREAKMAGVDLTDTNCYAANFDGADLRNAQFENAILSSASLTRSLRDVSPY